MSLWILAAMLFAFTFFVAVFEEIGKTVDSKNRRIAEITGKRYEEVDEELNIPFLQRFFIPAIYRVLKVFSRLFSKRNKRETPKLEKRLRLAGIRISASEYSAARFIIMLGVVGASVVPAILLELSMELKFLIIWIGVSIAFAGPTFYLSFRVKSRQQAIREQMPDVFDLLTVSVEAGLGFDAAILRIQERLQGPLVDELMIVLREIQMALPRREALRKLADRNSIPELKTFAGALIQAEQLGLPMKNILRVQSAQLRLERKQAAEERAAKAPVKMMLPLILFVFPVIFIVVLGPTVMQAMETFGK